VHLVCRECEEVQELPADALGDFAAQLLEQQGFDLDIGHTSLFGTCAACQASTTP
jgi:Fur family ferric uptake transcriptional regulator